MSKFTGIFLVVIIISLLCLAYYLDGLDYLQGKSWHYSGETIVTADQAVSLIEKHPVYYNGDIYLFELQDSGLVNIGYDFYGDDDYTFLTKEPFSYFDTPIIHSITVTDKSPYLIMAALLIIGIPLFIILNSPKHRKVKILAINTLWHIYHPLSLFKKQKAPYRLFNPIVSHDIVIDCKNAGIITLRTWKYLRKDGYLYSAGVGQMCWTSRIMYSDKIPADDNEKGIYSFRLGCLRDFDFTHEILGVVSVSGEYREHADGVLRAECCEILHLLVQESYSKIAGKLSSYYGVPVTVTKNNINEYCHWITDQNGIDCMKHNAEILMEVKDVNQRIGNQERTVASTK